MGIRITTWNIKWFGQLLKGYSRTIPRESKKATGKAKALQALQLEKIAEEIRRINADVMCIQEGPSTGNVDKLERFCADELQGQWSVITRPAGEAWHIRGSQGIFFLVRTVKVDTWQARLLPQSAWFEATEFESRVDIRKPGTGEHKKNWPIIHPLFKSDDSETLDEPEFGDEDENDDRVVLGDKEHNHYRHPQVLLLTIGDKRVDIIGCHFKSKYGGDDYRDAGMARQKETQTAKEKKLIKKVEQTAVEARIKLTTEIANVRYYIENRFRNEPNPALFVVGDFNDGVGKEVFERKYLFHDAVSNMQGDVFSSSRFLNHALFDYVQKNGEDYRWSTSFYDVWDPNRTPEILIDHVMFSQGLSGPDALEETGLRVMPKAGKVEHTIHNNVNSVFGGEGDYTSDHRPVTVDVVTNTGIT